MAETLQPDWYGMTDEEILAYPTVYRSDLLAGQTVLVSGGGTGIGRGIAYLCARLGANIVVCGRKEDNLRKAEGLIQSLGVQADVHVMTIRDADQVSAMMDAVWERFGRLDILVNNAGGQFPQEAMDYTPKGWNAVIDTNLTGSFYMMQAAGRKWRDNKQPGSIVNIIANFWRGMPHIAHTGAARAGVSYLAKSLGVEWAPYDIRVNCIAPGVIETEGLNVYPKQIVEHLGYRNVMKRLGTVMDIAEATVYIGGPSGAYITGETLTVDGGQQMWGDGWALGRPEYFNVPSL